MPWDLKHDMKFFQDTTTKTEDLSKQNALIMGRKTWESIPDKHRPLADRKNIVLSRNTDYLPSGADVFQNIDQAFESVNHEIEKIFIIGGGVLFKEALNHDRLTGIYLTRIFHKFECDTFFPEDLTNFPQVTKLGEVEEQGYYYEYLLYEKK